MAEALLRARLAERGIDVTVRSAGLLFDGEPAEPGAIAAMKKLGLDLRDHRAQTIRADLLEAADLVVTMEHRHVREVVMADGGDLRRTFTLPDLVNRAEVLVGGRGARVEPLPEWLDRLAGGRSVDDVMRGGSALEVADPMGQPNRVFRRCAAELDGLIERFVAAAWPEPSDAAETASSEAVPVPPQPIETRST
jgi:protein-tyrosine-phosphatase